MLKKIKNFGAGFTIWPLTFFFGWLLSFPFSGPLLHVAANSHSMDASHLGFVFIFFHALGLILGGILWKKEDCWAYLMVWSAGICLSLTVALWFISPQAWLPGMAAMGMASSLYVLGWSYPYTAWTGQARQIPFMAATILWANVIYILLNQLVTAIQPGILHALGTIPVAIAFWLAIQLKKNKTTYREQTQKYNNQPRDTNHRNDDESAESLLPLPGMLLLALSLFIFGFYVNGGLMYQVIQPFFSDLRGFAVFYWFLPYVAVLIFLWKEENRIRITLFPSLSASMMGISFVFFALLKNTTINYYATVTFLNGAFAFLDIFVWTTLGTLACLYGHSFKVFGIGLAANVSAISAGGVLGNYVLTMEEDLQIITALLAILVIFITLLIIPWLDQQCKKGVGQQDKGASPDHKQGKCIIEIISTLPGSELLTPRENEIVTLLLQELTNKSIAQKLLISENTLKTHLRNIYRKLGVSNKKELLIGNIHDQNHLSGDPKPEN